VQLQLPLNEAPADLAHQTARICELVAKARRGVPGVDLVVFPEYALHGFSMDTRAEIMCSLDGPETLSARSGPYELPWEDRFARRDGTSPDFAPLARAWRDA
jgi:formamidase